MIRLHFGFVNVKLNQIEQDNKLKFEYTEENHGGQKQLPLAFVTVHHDFGLTVVFHHISTHAHSNLQQHYLELEMQNPTYWYVNI